MGDILEIGDKRLLSLSEAARYMGVSRSTVSRLARQLNASRHIGARVLIDRRILDSYLDHLAKRE